MLTIPLFIGWELSRTANAKAVGAPVFRYKPDGNAAKENYFRLNIFHLADNTFKFVPVQDGYVSFTDAGGEIVKSSLSYEGFKKILVQYPYLVLLAKQTIGGKYKVFASMMFETIADERAVKIECLKYIKQINVADTKYTTTKADTQVKRVYMWEDLAFRFPPQRRSKGAPNRELIQKKQAFDAKNAAYYGTTPMTGTKARFAELTRKDLLSNEETKTLVRAVCVAYDLPTESVKLRFARRTTNTLGLARGHFEDFYDAQGNRSSVVSLMENSPHVILHEMAHVIAFQYYGRAVGGTHGDAFCGVYAHVLDTFCPYIVPHKAAEFMRANGLKVRPFDLATAKAAAKERTVTTRSHRDFEISHAVVAKTFQNRRIGRAFVARQQYAYS